MRDVTCLDHAAGRDWSLYRGDCVDVAAQLPDNSVGLAIYSPPFANLFVYSDSDRDMGNCDDDAEFLEHYGHLVRELFRVLRPGRHCAVHCSDLPSFKFKHGAIALRDFPGELIRIHESAGFHYHSRVTIWKCPVTEMQRTKALGLLFKQLRKDSLRSRQGMADYVIVLRKPGEAGDPEYVGVAENGIDLDTWQRWASPVWMDIDQTRTLNAAIAREDGDERHMCPLQLDVIDRLITLWSNRGDVVLSPFAGIGSEGVGALRAGRRFVGIELKESYFDRACINLRTEEGAEQVALFGVAR